MVQGSLRSREYEKDGVKHRVFELRADAIAKLDRAERKEEQDSTFRMSPASRPRFENGWFGSADERPKWPGRSGQCDPARTGVRSQDVLSPGAGIVRSAARREADLPAVSERAETLTR